ncbi:MAG TPA: hypothetical protein VKZ60_20055 [Chloroflexota bacterium]|jgi:hypothetical protein|nr:hypothetical protein [Chloroflexota bacterium]
MFWLKQCPQCGGDLLDESDVHGTLISCLQCGRTLTPEEERALRERVGRRSRARPPLPRAGAA